MRRRETGLLVFALAIVGASLMTETRRDVSAAAPVAGNAARSGENPQRRGEVAALDADEWLARLKARGMNTQPSGPGLFGGASWQPQPDPAANLPVKPQTPPFPFVLLGRMKLGDSTVVVVAKGEVSYTAKVGQVIEQFRVDRIDDDGLRVTYVPNGESRDYRYEQLYVSANAAPLPGSPMQQASPPMQPPQAVDSTDAQLQQPGQSSQAQQQAQSSSAPAEKPAAGRAGVGAAAGAAAGAALPINPTVQGASAPIGGMVIMPTPPGNGMVITPTPPGGGMVMTPTPPGNGMALTQPAAGSVMPSTPAPTSQ